MDKNRGKITIKFGQADNTKDAALNVEPVKAVAPVEREYQALADSGTSSIGNEAEPVHHIIEPKYLVPSPQKRGKRNGKAIAIGSSVIGAVAVGLILGSVVMNFMKTGADQQAIGGRTVNAAKKQMSAPASPATAGDKETPKITTGTVTKTSITLPSTSYYVVQGGVFQEQANAGAIMDKMKSHGWPNVFVGDKPLLLILGITVNRDNALALAGQYKEIDVFIKELKDESKTVSVSLKQGEKTSQEEWDQWFEKENEFIKTMGGAIGQGLSGGKLKDDLYQNITTTHRNLLQKGREIVNKLPESTQEQGNRLLNDYTKIVTAMENYQKQPGAGYLFQAEQALLDAYVSKKQLLNSFK